MKKILSHSILLGLLLALPVLAAPSPTAIENQPDVVFLGKARDPKTGKMVEGIKFIHYKKAPSHQKSGAKSGTSSCFAYLAKGAKWKTIEPWVMNGANSEALDSALLFGLESASLAKWEEAADGIVGNGVGVEIFGTGSATSSTLVADTSSPDGQNEVYFGDVSNPGVIAVTIVWGIFGGPISGRELVEWDQIYDQVDFDWSAEAGGVAGKMDFDNIATHENGHSGGISHPSDSCTEETMYRFSANGETKKRDLNTGDINGINLLY